MALSGVIKTGFDSGTIAVADGTGPPLSVTVRFDNADFSISGLRDQLRESTQFQGRGKLRSLRKTSRVFPSGSFSIMVAEFSESGTGTLNDLILGTAATPYAARASTTTALGDVMTFDITFTMEGTDQGDAADHTLVLNDCEITSIDFSEGEPNSCTYAFTMYGDLGGDLAIDAD